MQAIARQRLASRLRWTLLTMALIGLGATITLLVLAEATDYHILDNPLYQLLDNLVIFLVPAILFLEGVYFVRFGREQMEWADDMRRRGRWYSRLFNQKYNTPGWMRVMGSLMIVWGGLVLAFSLWRVLVLR